MALSSTIWGATRRPQYGVRIEPFEIRKVGEEIGLATRAAHEHLEVLEARVALHDWDRHEVTELRSPAPSARLRCEMVDDGAR